MEKNWIMVSSFKDNTKHIRKENMRQEKQVLDEYEKLRKKVWESRNAGNQDLEALFKMMALEWVLGTNWDETGDT